MTSPSGFALSPPTNIRQRVSGKNIARIEPITRSPAQKFHSANPGFEKLACLDSCGRRLRRSRDWALREVKLSTPESGFGDAEWQAFRASKDVLAVETWFVRVVLPLEPALMQFLKHNWRNQSDIADLRQDVYEQIFAAALEEIPTHPRQFVFTTARNLLINRIRDAQVVPFEAVSDIEALNIAIDTPGPDRSMLARDELRARSGGAGPSAAAMPRGRGAAADRRAFTKRNCDPHGGVAEDTQLRNTS